jgi:hypothetical protein
MTNKKNICVDYILRLAIPDESFGVKVSERNGSRNPAVMLSDLEFADGIALISNNTSNVQEMLSNVEIEAN